MQVHAQSWKLMWLLVYYLGFCEPSCVLSYWIQIETKELQKQIVFCVKVVNSFDLTDLH